jgi:very-short-patch-repair endonuclease
MTVGETRLWQALRALKLNIRRQAPLGPYIVDFVSHAGKLVIEVDGYHHSLPERMAADLERDGWLKLHGYRVLRVSALEACNEPGSIAERIAAELSPPSPTVRRARIRALGSPSRGKGE